MRKLDEITGLAKPAALKIKAQSFVRVVSHHDADGITACGIICLALSRLNIPFQATIIANLDEHGAGKLDASRFTIFCDMGSGQPDIVDNFDAVILDHHVPNGQHKNIQVNPHLLGIDGGNQISASGVCYALARALGENVDLAGLAISGAIGDKQHMQGPNGEILEEAVKAGVITVTKGMKLGKGPLEMVLEHSLDPYFDMSGNEALTKEFLKELDISGNIESLSPEDMKRLSSALSLKLLKKSPPEAIEALIGDVYTLNNELIKDVFDFTNTVNSCGKLNKPSLGLSICLRCKSALGEAENIRIDYTRQILMTVKEAIEKTVDAGALRYIDIRSSDVTGAVASIMIRYVMPDKPIIVLNQDDGRVKVSARGTSVLIRRGLDLSIAVREGAKAVGGNGGGHNIASGASIPIGTEKQFLEKVNAIIGGQLNGPV